MKELNLKLLQELSENDKSVPLYKKIIKLQEEAGEVAQEFLAYDDKQNGIRTNSSKSAEGTLESILEETCDTINVAIDILNYIEMLPEFKERFEEDFIEKLFTKKLEKWQSKQQWV